MPIYRGTQLFSVLEAPAVATGLNDVAVVREAELSDNLAILPDDDVLSIDVDVDRPANGFGFHEYLLRSKRTRQVLETAATSARKLSKGPR